MTRFKLPLLIITIFSFFVLISCQDNTENSLVFDAMDTSMVIRSFGKNSAEANRLAQKRILELENLISVTKDTSEVWKINNAGSYAQPVSEDTATLLSLSLKVAEESGGALNPCLYPVIREWGFTTGDYKVPSASKIAELLSKTDYSKIILKKNENFSEVFMQPEMMIDFGAVGKGYAGDCAIAVLKEQGIKSAILDLGGNVQTLGPKTDGSLWTIGIKSPWNGTPVAGVKVKDKAVITSGGYERFFVDSETQHKYIHIFDGKTGRPVENDVASVTIIAESGLYADSLSTTLVVLGKDGAIKFWDAHKDFDFIMILDDKTLMYTAPLKDYLIIDYDFEKVIVVS